MPSDDVSTRFYARPSPACPAWGEGRCAADGSVCGERRICLRLDDMPRDHPPLGPPGRRVGMTAEACSVCGQQLNAPAAPTAEGDAWPVSARCNGASGSVCAPNSCLLAPADDRNALATTAGSRIPT